MIMGSRAEHEAIKKGIFIQQASRNGRDRTGYCVTFPRLENGDAIFPTPTLRRYSEALGIARIIKHCDSRLRNTPIFVMQTSERENGKRGLRHRLLQLVER
jgi:hypothetical protein